MLSLRGEGFAQLRFHADRVATIGNAIEQFDMRLHVVTQDGSASEQQALVTAARNLADLLNGEVGQ